jgi:hypothetical protein
MRASRSADGVGSASKGAEARSVSRGSCSSSRASAMSSPERRAHRGSTPSRRRRSSATRLRSESCGRGKPLQPDQGKRVARSAPMPRRVSISAGFGPRWICHPLRPLGSIDAPYLSCIGGHSFTHSGRPRSWRVDLLERIEAAAQEGEGRGRSGPRSLPASVLFVIESPRSVRRSKAAVSEAATRALALVGEATSGLTQTDLR